MSIDDWVVDKVRVQKTLFPLWPRRSGDTVRRALLMSEEVYAALTAQRQDPDSVRRFAELRADLEHFVTSESIDSKYIFHLYPARDCIWEIRSVRDDPSIRVLGAFATRDVFIATTYALREDLGGWESREWKEIKRRAGAIWKAIMLPYKPCPGVDAAEHISGVLSGKFFKDRG